RPIRHDDRARPPVRYLRRPVAHHAVDHDSDGTLVLVAEAGTGSPGQPDASVHRATPTGSRTAAPAAARGPADVGSGTAHAADCGSCRTYEQLHATCFAKLGLFAVDVKPAPIQGERAYPEPYGQDKDLRTLR